MQNEYVSQNNRGRMCSDPRSSGLGFIPGYCVAGNCDEFGVDPDGDESFLEPPSKVKYGFRRYGHREVSLDQMMADGHDFSDEETIWDLAAKGPFVELARFETDEEQDLPEYTDENLSGYEETMEDRIARVAIFCEQVKIEADQSYNETFRLVNDLVRRRQVARKAMEQLRRTAKNTLDKIFAVEREQQSNNPRYVPEWQVARARAELEAEGAVLAPNLEPWQIVLIS